MQKIEIKIKKKTSSAYCAALFFSVKRVEGESGETPRHLVGELREMRARKKNAR